MRSVIHHLDLSGSSLKKKIKQLILCIETIEVRKNWWRYFHFYFIFEWCRRIIKFNCAHHELWMPFYCYRNSMKNNSYWRRRFQNLFGILHYVFNYELLPFFYWLWWGWLCLFIGFYWVNDDDDDDSGKDHSWVWLTIITAITYIEERENSSGIEIDWCRFRFVNRH